ncbi:MAG TPA: hypothetical protein VIF62_24590 [Labilithrix sp.]
MAATTNRHDVLEQIERIAQDIRVRLHLASMDAKDAWSKTLEPKVFEAREAARHAKDTTSDAAKELLARLETFYREL